MPLKTISAKTALQSGFEPLRILTLLCLAASVMLAACSNRTELDSSVRDLTFRTIDGKQIAMQQIDGPALINFWSTSCTVCLHEMPDLASLYTEFLPQGFELVAVAMPYDAPNSVLEMATERNFPFPVALDLKGEALAAFASVEGTPTSFLLDAKGKLVERYVGAIDMKKLRNQLNNLLSVS